MSAGDNLTPHNDRMLRMARAAKPRGRSGLSPKQIIMVRHMSNDGASIEEIIAALGWPSQPTYARKILAEKYRIFPKFAQLREHRGDQTTLPKNNFGPLYWHTYRPKWVRS